LPGAATPALSRPALGLGLVAVHTLAMLATMGAVALLVYQTVGLAFLRRAWINVDLLWACALVGAGLATVLLS